MRKKTCRFVGSAKRDLRRFPREVRSVFGFAIDTAQQGGKVPAAKPLKGLGAGILEVVENHDGDTYRAVYVARFKEAIYVLHAFKKKSKSGVKTPQKDIEVVKSRLKLAAADYESRSKG
jgi:phage-related protein